MLAGETSIGFSFHTIESERVDAGRVLFQGHLGVDYTSAPAEVDGELADAAASRLNELLEIMLGDAWTSQGWTVEGGTYHRRGEILPLQIFDARLTGCELQQRLQIFGTLRMPFSSRLRITSIEPVPRQTSLSQELALAIGDCRTDGRGVMVGCADGPLLIKTIHFLPARLFAFRLGGQLLAAGNSALPPRTAKRKRQTA
jgi:methionyl-tRNA formyltransferase